MHPMLHWLMKGVLCTFQHDRQVCMWLKVSLAWTMLGLLLQGIQQ